MDLSKTSALGIMASATGNATTDSGNLVDALGMIFMHGQMPAQHADGNRNACVDVDRSGSTSEGGDVPGDYIFAVQGESLSSH